MVQGTFVGVDVSASNIAVAVRPMGEFWTAESGDRGVNEVAVRLRGLKPELVVLEACGRQELPVAAALATAGLPFALVSSRNIREFARVVGRVTNHAGLLAQFAELVHPDPYALPNEVVQQLHELRSRRHDLLEMLASERGRVETSSIVVHRDLQNHIQFLDRALKLNGEQFNSAIRSRRISGEPGTRS